ncbi:hypothetical protein SAMN06295888_104185 [Desulfonatronum zhilinae]|nr:hypothetical protein SAMN06295888_104185 [Desulfonatronum zhilinae]
MFAMRAVYENGHVHIEHMPPLSGRHNMIVVFENIDDADALCCGEGAIPVNVSYPDSENQDRENFSLSCLEYAYGDDEPEYTDAMLKTVNPAFQP